MSLASQHLGHAREHPVDAAQRAALVAGDERRHAPAGARVALVLLDQRPGDGLHAGQHDRRPTPSGSGRPTRRAGGPAGRMSRSVMGVTTLVCQWAYC